MTNEFFDNDFLAAFRNAKNNNNLADGSNDNIIVGNNVVATENITTNENVSRETLNNNLESISDNNLNNNIVKDKSSLTLLTQEERLKLYNILNNIKNIKNFLKKCIIENDSRLRNAILFHGPAGNGKTTIVTNTINELIASGDALESNLVTGSITGGGLPIELAAHNSISKSAKNPMRNIRCITIFDDTNIFSKKDTFQILKNAFNTRTKDNNNRFVCYKSKREDVRFNYRGIGIFVCNDNFIDNADPDVQAFLSRCEDIELNMTTEELFIYGKYLLENSIKEDFDYDYNKFEKFIEFFNNNMQDYYNNGVFNKVFFSLRTMLVIKENFDENDNSWLLINNEFKRLANINTEIKNSKELLNKIENENRDKLNNLLADTSSSVCAFVNANLNNLINKFSFDYVLKAINTLKNAEVVYNKYKGRTNYLSIDENREYKRASHDFYVYKKDGFYDVNVNKKKAEADENC